MMPAESFPAWGRLKTSEQRYITVNSRHAEINSLGQAGTMLPRGNGRSYGDSCFNEAGTLLWTKGLDRFISFNPENGRIICESGVLLSEILDFSVPRGWFLPVVPGTQFVTVGGAIANDVHGKNHHVMGTFGSHVLSLHLSRSDGSALRCSRDSNPRMFAATVGGLGLTGMIATAEIQLRRVTGPLIDTETARFDSLDEFFDINRRLEKTYEYTVSWVDCGPAWVRGIFTAGNHSSVQITSTVGCGRFSYPLNTETSFVNRLSVAAFNSLYFHRPWVVGKRTTHFQRFFFPLDGVRNWNRLYGKRGFYQYQCVIPAEDALPAVTAMLKEIGRSGLASSLSVLKTFGDAESPGMLSFPLSGTTLAMDFANRGVELERLFVRLDAIVAGAGGRLYPAKDARMPGRMFKQGFPRWKEFSHFIDPCFSSDFWRRVMTD